MTELTKQEKKRKLIEILEYYKTLDYQDQRTIIRSLSVHTKTPPYYITFTLDQVGIAKMAQVMSYCKKYEIEFKPEKRGNTKIAFCFQDLSARNMALIGRLTVS